MGCRDPKSTLMRCSKNGMYDVIVDDFYQGEQHEKLAVSGRESNGKARKSGCPRMAITASPVVLRKGNTGFPGRIA